MKDRRVKIGVFPQACYDQLSTLLEALQDLAYVRFQPCREDELGDFSFLILGCPDSACLPAVRRAAVRTLVYDAVPACKPAQVSGRVVFADRTELDPALRGASFVEDVVLPQAVLELSPSDAVLATRQGQPFWLRRRSGDGLCDVVGVAPRPLPRGELLRERLSRTAVAELVPLIQFMREAAGPGNWQSAAIRACFVLDDPSLYWPSYGYVRFAELCAHARRHRYHLAIATIPLDTWYIDRQVAELLTAHREQVSLIVHGNNHINLELLRPLSEAARMAELAQGLRRFGRLQKHPGIARCQVIEPPYGVIDGAALPMLARLGYAAALYTPSQFIVPNRGRSWPASLGAAPVDPAPCGLCTIPRLVMSRDWREDVAIAAFLRQPIVLAGHHQDFFSGLGLLEDFSTAVNRLGSVIWSSPDEIARASYLARVEDGSTWVLRMGGRAVDCRLPPEAKRIVIERPWLETTPEPLVIGRQGVESPWRELTAGRHCEPMELMPEDPRRLSITSLPNDPVDANSVLAPSPRIWPVVRKMMVEARDRLYPYLPERWIRRLRARVNC